MKATAFVFSGLALIGNVSAEVLSFDNTGVYGREIPNGYGGLDWNNLIVIDPYNFGGGPDSGYATARVLGLVAINGGGQEASLSSALNFNLESAYFAAAWNDGLNLELVGYDDNIEQYRTTILLNPTNRQLISFNWIGVDTVVFNSYGGTPHEFVGQTPWFGTHFGMDELSISQTTAAVPEPQSWALLFAALGLLTLSNTSRSKKDRKQNTLG